MQMLKHWMKLGWQGLANFNIRQDSSPLPLTRWLVSIVCCAGVDQGQLKFTRKSSELIEGCKR